MYVYDDDKGDLIKINFFVGGRDSKLEKTIFFLMTMNK